MQQSGKTGVAFFISMSIIIVLQMMYMTDWACISPVSRYSTEIHGYIWVELRIDYLRRFLMYTHHFACLLITFANCFNPDQARHNVGPDLDQNCLTL